MTQPPCAELDPADPRRLGDYDLVGLLGAGGMGRVYLGQSPTGRLVAVKVIRRELLRDDQYRLRFRSEVERARQVPSFSTAEVLDADPDHDPPYVVFEFVEGRSLAEVVEHGGPLTPANLRSLAIGIAAALRAIHDAGVIHRDLKPSNVLLSPSGPKVIDFGIARTAVDPVPLTRGHDVVGTIPYMSPERFSGEDRRTVTPAADIFSWGGVVVFAGTGRIPFPADSTGAVLGRIAIGDPDTDGLTEPVRSLVQRALTRDPARRPTARDLIDQLTADVPSPAPLDRPTGVTPTPWAMSSRPVPRQLPAPPWGFAGRRAELAALTAMLATPEGRSEAVPVAIIGGIGGIGKTCLAVRWAHDNIPQFPDGQLYVNLRGFEPRSVPVAPAAALWGFLEALGIEPPAIPGDVDAQAALYRSIVADRRLLVVLDNVRDSGQAAPLLPGTPTCAVLITSRRRLGALVTKHGARPISLDVLDAGPARQLLTGMVGRERVDAEPDAVTAVLSVCAGLPLALSIIAARAAAHPGFALSVLAGELQHESTRLDALDAGELTANLRAIFSASYHSLESRAAAIFRLMGIAPEPDIGLDACASLGAEPVAGVRGILRELVACHLVQEHVPGRYRMHDLVRLYAAERARLDEPPEGRCAALRRLVDFYLHTAYAGDRLLYAHRPPIALDPPQAGTAVLPIAHRGVAIEWFKANHACLLAVHALAIDQRWDQAVWQLAWALTIFHWRQGHLHHHFAAWQAGLAAAERLRDDVAQSEAHRLLGHACGQRGMLSAAQDHLRQALALSENAGDLFAQGHTHQLLAWVAEHRGDNEQAMVHARQTLRAARALDNPVWTAIAWELTGSCHARLGRFHLARMYCEQALRLHRAYEHPEGEADTLQTLGYIAHHQGAHFEALSAYAAALTLRRESGDTYSEAQILEWMGETHAAAGEHAAARNAWRSARDLYRSQGRAQQASAVQERLREPALNAPRPAGM